jgi:hypothetical protein
MRRVILQHTSTVFWLTGGTISLNYTMYMGLMMLGREICTAEPLVPELSTFEAQMTAEKLQLHKTPRTDQFPTVFIEGGEESFALISINLFVLFGIMRKCLTSGRSRLLYLSIRRAIKQTVIIIEHVTFVNYIQNFIQHSRVKVNSICRGNYWGSSVWISKQQVK